MVTSLTSGEIYFIREEDYLTNEISSYVKIGLVREGDGRDSDSRAMEHQTGNPRKLSIHKVVKTAVVSSIENILHCVFANHRVSGEWFRFDDLTLKRCFTKAESLAAEANANIGYFNIAQDLKNRVSVSTARVTTVEISLCHEKYLRAEVISRECDRLSMAMKEIFIEALVQEEEVGHIITKQEKKTKLIFDQEKFELTHPEVFAKYQKVKESVSGAFRWVRPKEFASSLEVISPEFAQFASSLEVMIESAKEGKTTREALHAQDLRLLGFAATAEWEMEIATVNVQAFCADSAGVENICKWVREMKSKTTFDEKLFREELPDLYAEFTREEAGGVAHIVNPKQGYANKEAKMDNSKNFF